MSFEACFVVAAEDDEVDAVVVLRDGKRFERLGDCSHCEAVHYHNR